MGASPTSQSFLARKRAEGSEGARPFKDPVNISHSFDPPLDG